MQKIFTLYKGNFLLLNIPTELDKILHCIGAIVFDIKRRNKIHYAEPRRAHAQIEICLFSR